ncbi:MAG: hypothetical protein H7144_17345 [Burkholderiales bacterium]|nr:hypothetical protein [Phycisphaerae bacterium]
MNTAHRRVRRRGIAMVLVLSAVAATSVLAYALLTSASMQAQVTNATADRIQRKYLAESGLNLALYYLQNPTASPVSLVYGTNGNIHYPGESNVVVPGMSGTLNIAVSNSANGIFDITSVATLDSVTTTAYSQVQLKKSRVFSSAANLKGNVSLTPLTIINGGVITDGTLNKGLALVNGLVTAVNGLLFGGNTYPSGTSLSYPMTAFYYMPFYFYDGKRYTAKSLPANVVTATLLDADTVNNPQNVWYASNDVKFLSSTTMTGTVVVKRDLTLQGNLTVTPKTGMPSLIIGRRLEMSGALRNLTSNGVTYLGEEIRASGLTGTSTISVSGAFIAGQSGWPVDGFAGWMFLSHNSSRSTLSGFADEMETINSVNIRSWEIDNARPK